MVACDGGLEGDGLLMTVTMPTAREKIVALRAIHRQSARKFKARVAVLRPLHSRLRDRAKVALYSWHEERRALRPMFRALRCAESKDETTKILADISIATRQSATRALRELRYLERRGRVRPGVHGSFAALPFALAVLVVARYGSRLTRFMRSLWVEDAGAVPIEMDVRNRSFDESMQHLLTECTWLVSRRHREAFRSDLWEDCVERERNGAGKLRILLHILWHTALLICHSMPIALSAGILKLCAWLLR